MDAGRSPRVLSAEQRAALARIAGLVEYWRITAEELDGDLPSPPAAAPPQGYVKYRHPVTGDTWDGHGAQPDWLRHALLKEGYLVSELRPQPSADA
jgi:DNA-binding protein H-NS